MTALIGRIDGDLQSKVLLPFHCTVVFGCEMEIGAVMIIPFFLDLFWEWLILFALVVAISCTSKQYLHRGDDDGDDEGDGDSDDERYILCNTLLIFKRRIRIYLFFISSSLQ